MTRRGSRHAVSCLVLLALVALSLGGCDWTSYMNGSAGSGYTFDVTPAGVPRLTPENVPTLVKKWSASSGGAAFAQPVVANGTVYWGSFDGFERATDTNGNLLWQTFIGKTTGLCYPPSVGVASTATYRSDVTIGTSRSVIFVGGGDANLYALDAHSGAVLWSRSLGPSPDTMIYDSPAYYNGAIYLGISSYGDCPLVPGKFLRIDSVTGNVLNTLNLTPGNCTGAGVWGSPTLDAPNGYAYFATGNSDTGNCGQTVPLAESIIKVSLADLSVVDHWTIPSAERETDGDFGSTPNLFDGTINGAERSLVGAVDKNGIYYAFDRSALGAGPVWRVRIALGGEAPANGRGPVTPGAWDPSNHRLYLGGDTVTIAGISCKGSISAVNPDDGSFLWRDCLTDGFDIGAVTAAPGFAIVGEGKHLMIVATADGRTLFNYTGTALLQGPATIANGVVYATDTLGNLSAFAPSST